MIVFRADGNAEIGSGHIMRCLSLAKELRKQGADCVFITADGSMQNTIATAGFAHISLETSWNNMDAELPVLLPFVQRKKPSCVIADSYFVTENWMQEVRKISRIVYVDDMNAQRWPADVLVNYNLYASGMNYERYYKGTSTKLLLGASYVPLREEFQMLPPRIVSPIVKNVLISTGGADAEHITIYLLKNLQNAQEWRKMNFHLVVGALNEDIDKITELAACIPNVILHCNVQKMSELMLTCDLAVAAAGSTLYELCACGIPCITYVLAANQMEGAAVFAREGLMLNAGDWRVCSNLFAEIEKGLRRLVDLPNERKQMAWKMQKIVDGKGAMRLAAELLASNRPYRRIV